MNFRRYPDLKGTIFIVTYGRSGSTLLQSLLQSIPRAHIVGENYNVAQALFQGANRARRAKKTWGKKAHPEHHPWYGAHEIAPNRFERALARVFVEEIIRPPKDVRWFGFKEIRYPAFGDDLPDVLAFYRRNFPNAQIVFNSRDAQEVAKSKWWAKRPAEEVHKLVAQMDQRFADYTAANPDHAHHAFHAQTAADPAALQPLFDKLGEPLDPETIRAALNRKLEH
jgi:hypothetical protein